MPILVALDEFDCALTRIAIQAELGLASREPEYLEAALRLILVLCRQTDAIVEDVLSHAVSA
jgi:hypothetical protein